MMRFPFGFLAQSSDGASLLSLTFDTSSFSYSGAVPLPITQDMLSVETLASIDVDATDLRAWADEEKTTPIPIDVIAANPSYAVLSQMRPNYGSHIGPAAEYYADLGTAGKIVWARLDYQRYYIEVFDCASESWEDTIFVGVNPFSNCEMGDDHTNPSIIRDADDGTWHLFANAHARDGVAHWTAAALTGTWTPQTTISDTVNSTGLHSYNNVQQVGDDLALFVRSWDNANDKRPTTLYTKSTSWATGTYIADLSTGGPSGDNDVRTYHLWIEEDPGNGGRTTEKWFHFLLLRHQDDSTFGYRRNHLFHAVLRFSLTAGEISSWRWHDINGVALATADTAIGWADVTASDSTYLIGTSANPGYVVENTRSTDSAVGLVSSANLVFDGDDNPHFLISLSTGLDRASSDTLHFTHDGTDWSATAIPELSGTGWGHTRCGGLMSDGGVISGLVTGYTTEGDYDTGKVMAVSWNGSTWSVNDVSANIAPFPDSSYCFSGSYLASPVVVKNKPAAVAGPDVIIPSGVLDRIEGVVSGLTEQYFPAIGLPQWAMMRSGEVVKSKRLFIVVKPTVTASADTTIYLSWGDGGSTPAPTDTYGRNVVWSDYTCVSFVEPLLQNQSLHPFTNRTGGSSVLAPIGALMDKAGNGVVFSSDGSTIVIPPMWITYKNGLPVMEFGLNGPTNIPACMTTTGASNYLVQNKAITDSCVFGLIGEQPMRLAFMDESETTQGVWSELRADDARLVVYNSTATDSSVSYTSPTVCFAAFDFSSDANVIGVDGDKASVTKTMPTLANLNGMRVGMMRRSSGDTLFNGGFSGLLYAEDVDIADWVSNGRAELESAAWMRLTSQIWGSAS